MEVELLEECAPLPVRPTSRRVPTGVKDVKRDEHDRDLVAAVEHPLAEAREAGLAIIAERDELTVER
ncbi:MAG TPA: hypothetical protein VFJ50_10775 [Gemmatimonadales bacterium]|nr:hypothetical protein [Gemmatimonadales bacterium]